MKPRNFEEKVIWYAITGTYGFYALGALYLLAPVVGWVLLGYLIKKLWQAAPDEKITIPDSIWVWIAAMGAMEVALIAGHLDFDLGPDLLIKSSIGWAKGWALLAIFPLIGCLNIRPSLLYRAACVVCLHTLILIPILYLGYLVHLPARLYVSPLRLVGGPGPEFFSVVVYGIDPGNGSPRWQLFTPWAPALGFVANVYFFFALQERELKWRWIGALGCIAMCLVSASRLSLLSVGAVFVLTAILTKLSRPTFLIAAGFVSLGAGIMAGPIKDAIESFSAAFKGARAASSRVREILGRIALDRWEKEAPTWGHGIVERGPHLVEFMPIGSHHSWFGLLFVKGIVGFGALAVALGWSFIDLVWKSQHSKTAGVGLSMVLILFLYTFGENLEILAYLFWPGLVLMGIAFRRSNADEQEANDPSPAVPE